MQLICNGVRLDMPADAKLTLTKENPLFSFDNLKCERTTEFQIPATPTNDAVFLIARNAATYGAGMRQRYRAQLIEGACVKVGDLYVTAYTGGAYKAVFVTGQLIGLQRLREAGNVPELVDFPDALDYPQQVVTPADENKHFWEVVRYQQDRQPLFPSMDARTLADAAANAVGARIDWAGVPEEVRIVPDVPHGLSAQVITLASTINDPTQPNSEPLQNYNALNVSKAGLFGVFVSEFNTRVMSGQEMAYRVAELMPNTDVRLTFPDDFSDDLFLVSWDIYGEQTFLGGYEFNQRAGETKIKSGEPFAGRSVTIPRGVPFLICDIADFNNGLGPRADYGWHFIHGVGLSWTFDVHAADATEEDALPAVVWAQDNLPDVSLVDLLKTFAAISGRLLYYENGVVSFDACDVAAWPRVELDAVLKVEDLERRFADYKRANIIEYDTAANVPAWQRIRRIYAIENEYLQPENVLQTIPFSEGASTGGIYGDAFTNANAREDADKWGICVCLNGRSSMQRAALPENAGLARLCDSSTACKLTAAVSALEFEQITPKTCITYAGVSYVWTSATWSDGVAVFECARV